MGSIQLERFDAEDESPAAAADELLAAIDAFAADWIAPLGIGFMVECCDPEDSMSIASAGSVPDRSWFMRTAAVPVGVWVQAPFAGAREEIVSVVDSAVLARAVRGALEQRCGGRFVTALGRLRWSTVRVRIPTDEAVELKDGAASVHVPIETINGARWALGPTPHRAGVPIDVAASYEQGVTSLRIRVYCDLWLRNRDLLDGGVARVLARGAGWSLS